MRNHRLLDGEEGALALSPRGDSWLCGLGIAVEELRGRARPLVRCCHDWSERRDHLAGAVGAALLSRLFELRLARRESISRTVLFTARGEAFLRSLALT